MLDPLFIVEWTATLLGIIFLVLMMRENSWCWFFGILSSALSVYLFYENKLYSETILYVFYVLFGIYGWWKWKKPSNTAALKISRWARPKHAVTIILGGVLALGLGYFFKHYTDADKSYIDAQTSVFGLIATYLEAHKILGGWIYWIVINGVTIWLYYTKGLTVYVWLMVVYFILSFVGFYQWRKRYETQSHGALKQRY